MVQGIKLLNHVLGQLLAVPIILLAVHKNRPQELSAVLLCLGFGNPVDLHKAGDGGWHDAGEVLQSLVGEHVVELQHLVSVTDGLAEAGGVGVGVD